MAMAHSSPGLNWRGCVCPGICLSDPIAPAPQSGRSGDLTKKNVAETGNPASLWETAVMASSTSASSAGTRSFLVGAVIILLTVTGWVVWGRGAGGHGERVPLEAAAKTAPDGRAALPERLSPGGPVPWDTPMLPPAELPAPQDSISVRTTEPVTVSPPASDALPVAPEPKRPSP
jgi:hypothetical protein